MADDKKKSERSKLKKKQLENEFEEMKNRKVRKTGKYFGNKKNEKVQKKREE